MVDKIPWTQLVDSTQTLNRLSVYHLALCLAYPDEVMNGIAEGDIQGERTFYYWHFRKRLSMGNWHCRPKVVLRIPPRGRSKTALASS